MNSQVFEKCDLFIHQCIWEKNFYGSEYASSCFLKNLNKKCQVIGIPNLYRMPRFLFPQMREYGNSIYWEAYNFFPFRDNYIDENYRTMSVDELEELILDPSLISTSEILEAEELFFEKVAMREKQWDIKILNWLKGKIRKEQLFYDPNHPTERVLRYIADNIFDILNIRQTESYSFKVVPMDTYELPIYESVRQALNLEYTVKYIRNSNGMKLCNNLMDYKEYIRQYICWNFPLYDVEKNAK